MFTGAQWKKTKFHSKRKDANQPTSLRFVGEMKLDVKKVWF